jgi:hypothetical protein
VGYSLLPSKSRLKDNLRELGDKFLDRMMTQDVPCILDLPAKTLVFEIIEVVNKHSMGMKAPESRVKRS